MQARYYDPVIGRFYSNDPIGFRDVHSFNRYAYANNNPYKYTDPTGMCSNDPKAAAADVCQSASKLDTSQKGQDHIKKHENDGYSKDYVHDDGAGNLTAGYGHKVTPSDNMTQGQHVPQSQAEQLLQADLPSAEAVVENLVGNLPVSQNEFDALTDLAYNVGPVKLTSTNSPGLHKTIAAGDYKGIQKNLVYTKANGKQMPGLIDRSQARQKLFSGK